MGTVRLSGYVRDSIKNALLDHAFGTREAELEEALQELGRAVYEDVYPEALRKQMDALPKGFLPEDNDLYVCFDGDFTQVSWGEGHRRIAAEHSSYRAAAAVYGPRHELSKRYFHLAKLRAKLQAERKDAAKQASAILGSVTTVAALIKRWPEVAPFAKQHEARAKPQLLALPLKQLNKQLGLPVEEATP